jgi:hypothetical protein
MSEMIDILKQLTSPSYNEKRYIGADRAVNEAAVGGPVTSFNEFEDILVRVIVLIHKYVLKVRNPIEGARENYLDAAFKVLNKKLGPSGFRAGFERARTGKEGGIYGVIKLVAYGYTDVLFENESKSKVGFLWQQMSNDQRFAVMDEYIAEFASMWPHEMTENGAVRLKVNFPKTLQLHIENIRKLQNRWTTEKLPSTAPLNLSERIDYGI